MTKLTYPALASSVQHNGGMVLGDKLRHMDGRKSWRKKYLRKVLTALGKVEILGVL